MSIEVKIPTILRAQTGGASVVHAEGATLGQLFEDLEGRHPGVTRKLRAGDGGLKRFVNVYINDQDARFAGSLEAPVHAGDVVSIVPAVAGG